MVNWETADDSEGIPYSGSPALGRVPKVSSRCITESKRLRSRPDSRERRARCSGDRAEVICWAPKRARVSGQYSRCGCVLLARPPPHSRRLQKGTQGRCEFPGFTVASGGPLPRGGFKRALRFEFLKLLEIPLCVPHACMWYLCTRALMHERADGAALRVHRRRSLRQTSGCGSSDQ